MAKHKKKTYSVDKRDYPPLSRLDKFIYYFVTTASIITLWLLTILRIADLKSYFFKSDETLAYSPSLSIFFNTCFPMFVTVFIIIFMDVFNTRAHPIFGNKKVDYYNTSKYLFTLPMFDKRYKNVKSKSKKKLSRYSKRFIAITLAVMILFIFVSLLGIFGRDELSNDSIKKYNCLNQLKKSYSYSEVISYSLESNLETSYSRYSSSRYPNISLTLTLKDGKNMQFDFRHFNGNLYSMQTVVDKLSYAKKSVNDEYLNDFIDEYDFSEEEIQILNNLFDD
ncbi:MAG: hypothetical protein NC122_03865 [Faecalibacterium sp.]|nr:hypothetical protein [Ruminococcus sp.]MCM1392772.1 hypothetical protein [Ruminococcus sp.]MCM1485322.1 hypothetical protein [Faecalibacterium sp.]